MSFKQIYIHADSDKKNAAIENCVLTGFSFDELGSIVFKQICTLTVFIVECCVQTALSFD